MSTVSIETAAGQYTKISAERARHLIEKTMTFIEDNQDATDEELRGAFNDLSDVFRVAELVE